MAMLTRTAFRFRPITRIALRSYATEGESPNQLVNASDDTPQIAKDVIKSPPTEQTSPTDQSSSTESSTSTVKRPKLTTKERRQRKKEWAARNAESGDASSAPTTPDTPQSPTINTSSPGQKQSSNPPISKTARDTSILSTLKSNKAKRAAFTPISLRSPPPHLLTLADLSPAQIASLLRSAAAHKYLYKTLNPLSIRQSLTTKTVALMFSKRSTRTRVASETAVNVLGGSAMFLGSGDVQLGVNESLEDTARVVGSMVDGIMARVGEHSEVETLAKYSPVPVINALSRLYHPTQILADLQTLWEIYAPVTFPDRDSAHSGLAQSDIENHLAKIDPFECLKGKKAAWVGDTNNITNELLVTLPRLGMELAVASPKGYNEVEPEVWKRVVEAGTEGKITLTQSPEEALKDADLVITDTWISMGQEKEKAARLSAFSGYQITNEMVNSAGAKADWKFLHCLPRKSEEVDDEVFYGERSVVFQEAENRKWTTIACFDELFSKWRIGFKESK